MGGSLKKEETEEGIVTGIGTEGIEETEMGIEGLVEDGKREKTEERGVTGGEMGTGEERTGEVHPGLAEMMTEEAGGILGGEEMMREEIEMVGIETGEMGEEMKGREERM